MRLSPIPIRVKMYKKEFSYMQLLSCFFNYKKSVLLIFLVFTSALNLAHADWMDWGLESICEPTENRMVILPIAVWNREADHSDRSCVFVNGGKVLARSGYGSARPYGMGGANPDKWLSVWIDEIKVINKLSYECGGEGVCGLYFIVTSKGYESCTFKLDEYAMYQKFNLEEKPKHNCTIILNSGFPKETDRLEFPQKDDPIPPEAGSIVIEYAVDSDFCSLFLSDKFNFYNNNWEALFLKGGSLIEYQRGKQHGNIGRWLSYSNIDIDNDGALEHVYTYSAETNFRDADIHFIFKEGQQPAFESVINSFDELLEKNSVVFPSRDIDDGYYPLNHWPKSSFVNVAGFRVRYLRSSPFVYKEKTFFSTHSREEELLNIFTIIQLNNDGSTTDICYFRKVKKNY